MLEKIFTPVSKETRVRLERMQKIRERVEKDCFSFWECLRCGKNAVRLTKFNIIPISTIIRELNGLRNCIQEEIFDGIVQFSDFLQTLTPIFSKR